MDNTRRHDKTIELRLTHRGDFSLILSFALSLSFSLSLSLLAFSELCKSTAQSTRSQFTASANELHRMLSRM